MAITLDGTTGITTPGLTNTGTETIVSLTTTGNTTLGDATTDTLTVGVTGIVKDASGNVGIGTASPSGRLNLAVGASTSCTMRFTANNTGTGAGDKGRLDFYSADNSGTAYQLGYMDYDRSDGTGTASYIAWANRVAGTVAERMRISSAGDVGIGTSSPGYKLDVQSSASSGAPLMANFQSAGGDPQVYISNGTVKTQITADGTNSVSIVGSFSNHPLVFRTNNTERARIDTSGNLMLNTTSVLNSGKQSLFFNGLVEWGLNIKTTYSTTNGSNFLGFFAAGGSQIGGITQATSTTVAYNTSSDYRLKENVTPLANGLTKVMALKPCHWTWKTYADYGEGFIAHELAEICPNAVTGQKDAVDADGNPKYQGVDTSFLVATLTAAIQEQQALITSLTARITALETP